MERKKRVGAKKRSTKNPVIIKASLIVIVFFILFATVFKITEFILTNETDNFPKLEISLKNVPIEEIDAGPKTTIYPNNTVTLTTNDKVTTYKDVEIKGRGNSTWWQIKKPYQIKLSQKDSLFDYAPSKKWILLADYQDETHLRNDIAFYLERLFKADRPIGGHHIEFYVDNLYHGLYYLTEKIEIDKSRLNLKDPSGIIVEIDNLHNINETCPLYSKNGDCLIVHDIVNPDLSDESMSNFVKKFNELETAVSKKDFSTISELIDVDSFAKYFLIKEFTNDQDAYGSSFFLYTDGENDKIHTGPGWDFDAAFGNKHLGEYSEALSPSSDMIFKNASTNQNNLKTATDEHALRISTLLYDLMDVPEFESRVKEIYQETLSGKSEELLEYIRKQADYIRPAALRDQERWKLKANFDEEVEYLIDWVAKRYDHFEQIYGANSSVIILTEV